MNRLALLVALVVLSLVPPATHAQQAVLRAGVTDANTGEPIADAELVLMQLGRVLRSDSQGRLKMDGVPTGRQRVRVRKLGYRSADVELYFKGDTVTPSFMLVPEPLSLDTVHVRAERVPIYLEAFEQRRTKGIGRYLTEAQLWRDRDREFAPVLSSRFPGIRVAYKAYGNWSVESMRPICGGMRCVPCEIRFYLDGMKIDQELLFLVRTWDLAGIEYYQPETMPVQYREPGANCAVILLWSKR